MPDVRRCFLDAARTAQLLVGEPAVAERWGEPSALAEFTVRGLAGHLAGRTLAAVLEYLERDEPPADGLLDPSGYYHAVLTDDIHDELNRGVRERGETYAAAGAEALAAEAGQLLDRLRDRLSVEPENRRIEVIAGLALTLDDYLVTRLVELLVHTDDLAVSVGLTTPTPDPQAVDLVVACLTGIGRRRHGDLAVVRALSRRERDRVDALRVL